METQFFLRKGDIFSEEEVLAYFFSLYRVCQIHVTIYKGPKCRMTLCLEDIRSFLYNIGCWKQKILKKSNHSSKKKSFWPIFSRIIEHDKRQGTTYECPKGNLSLLWKLKYHFLRTWEVGGNTNFFKKRRSFQWRKSFGLFFLALSSVTNLTWQFIRVQSVGWQ